MRNQHTSIRRIMYVLCTLLVLTLHSLFKNCHKALESRTSLPGDGGSSAGQGVPRVRRHGRGLTLEDRRKAVDRRGLASRRPEGEQGRGDSLHNVPDSRKQVQVRRGRWRGGEGMCRRGQDKQMSDNLDRPG